MEQIRKTPGYPEFRVSQLDSRHWEIIYQSQLWFRTLAFIMTFITFITWEIVPISRKSSFILHPQIFRCHFSADDLFVYLEHI